MLKESETVFLDGPGNLGLYPHKTLWPCRLFKGHAQILRQWRKTRKKLRQNLDHWGLETRFPQVRWMMREGFQPGKQADSRHIGKDRSKLIQGRMRLLFKIGHWRGELLFKIGNKGSELVRNRLPAVCTATPP